MIRPLLCFALLTSCAISAPLQDDPSETHAYDVHPLTTRVSDSVWLGLGLEFQLPGLAAMAKQDPEAWLFYGEDLITLVKEQCPGGVWEAAGTRIFVDEGKLRLTGPRSLHGKVASFLAAARTSLGRTLALEASIVTIDPALFEEIRSASPGEHPQTLSAEQAGKILQAGAILKTGRVRAVPGRRVSLQDVATETYVRDYDVQISTGAGELDPVMNEFTTGTSIDLRPFLHPVEDSVILDVRGFVSEKEGIDEKKLRLQKDIEVMEGEKENVRRTGTRNLLSEVTVQQPRLSLQTLRTTLTVRDRETAIVGAVKRGDVLLLFLVTPRILPASEPPADPKAPRILDLRGFKETPRDYAAPALSLPSHPSAGFTSEESGRDRSLSPLLEDLKDALETGKEAELVRVHDEFIVAPISPRAQAEVAKFIASARTPSITCEGVLIGFRKGAKADWEHALDLSKGVEADVLAKLRLEAAKGTRIRLLEAAEVTGLSGQRIHAARIHERTYVYDYQPQMSSLVSIFDPIIGTLQTGFVFEVRPRSGTPLSLEVGAALAEATIKETPDLATGVGLVQLPRITGLRWNCQVACTGDRWTLVGVESRGQGETMEDVALFVRARLNVSK
jgi:hypothetical protein